MFCNQCEQTAKGTGCMVTGVCGKKPDVSALQDLLVNVVRGLANYAAEGRRVGVVDQEVNRFTVEALFATLTNVDFDPARFQELINRGVALRNKFREKVKAAGGDVINDPAADQPAAELKAWLPR